MDENLINQIEENDEIEDIEVTELDVPVEDIDPNVSAEEIPYEVSVEYEKEVEIDISESMGWVSGDNRYHDSLLGIDFPNQHPITSIRGLREELDEIERLKTVYSDKPNVANYYEWKDAAYDEYGYFVSIVPNTSKIDICRGTDIFGVSVDPEFAGFVGRQNAEIPRGGSYGLIVTSGLVDVRCELSVEVGDFVISNTYGYARKSNSNYGYKVVARENKRGIEYAVIALGVQADITNILGIGLREIEERVDVNETNIVSAINVANQAYNKASEVETSNGLMSDKVDNALGVVDKVVSDVENLGSQVSSSMSVSAQARAIAESAATSAESMKNEAVEKANEALGKNTELREEFEAKIAEIDAELDNVVSASGVTKEELEATKKSLQDNIDAAVNDLEELEKDLEPLATWPDAENPTGVVGFVARANEDSATLASIVTWKGDAGDSLAGFVQETTENNATVKSIASYKRKDTNGNIIEPGGATGLTAQVDANQSELNAVASYEKDGTKGLAGLRAQVDENTSSVSVLADYEYKDKDGNVISSGLSGLTAQVTQDAASLSTLSSYEHKDDNGNVVSSGLAGLISQVDQDASTLSTLANYEHKDENGNVISSGVAGLVTQVDANSSELETLAKFEQGNNKGISGIVAQVNADASELSNITSHTYTDGNGVTKTGLAAIDLQVTDQGTAINNFAGWQGETNTAVARIEQKADANGAYIQSTVSNMDKYAVGPYSQAYGFTRKQAQSVLEVGMIYVPTENQLIEEYVGEDEVPTYTREFSQGYLYRWGEVSDGYGWITVDQDYSEENLNTSAPSVFFSHAMTPTVAQCDTYGYWYTDGTPLTGTAIGYEPYTLYKWDLYDTKDDAGNATTARCWVPVATLAGNSSNRAVSQIRQDANDIEQRVTNTEGSYAGMRAELTETQASVQQLSAWKDGEEEKMASVKTVSDDNGASVVISALQKNGDTTEEMASLVLNVVEGVGGDSVSALTIDADYVEFNGQKLNIKVDATNIEGSLTIGQLNDETANKINNSITSTVIEYALGNGSSPEDEPTTGWSTTAPQWQEDKYMWQKTTITYTDSNKKPTTTTTCIQGAKGAQGIRGEKGDDGQDGKTPVKGVDYFDGTDGKDGADGEDGTSIIWKGSFDIAPNPAENGWAYYDTKEKASYVYQDGWYQMSVDGVDGQDGSDGSSIVWKGELSTRPENGEKNWVYKDAEDGIVYICTGNGLWEPMVLDGSDGVDGTNGTDGLSVFITYHNSTDTPSTPMGDGTADGWHTDATSDVVWMSQKVAASATEGEWGAPIKIKGQDGADGDAGSKVTNIVTEYYIATNNTTPPDSTASDDNGWFGDFDATLDRFFTLKGITGKNLLPFPYADGNKTFDGVSVSNIDGKLILNGSNAPGTAEYFLGETALEAGKYVLSYTINGTCDGSVYLKQLVNGEDWSEYNGHITLDSPAVVEHYLCLGGVSADVFDCDVAIQLEKGTSATAWEPYVSSTDFSESGIYYIWSHDRIEYTSGDFTYSDATVDNANSVVAMYCKENNVTKIDGGNIATGTITANQIAANAITADKISVSDLSALNATISGWNMSGDKIYCPRIKGAFYGTGMVKGSGSNDTMPAFYAGFQSKANTAGVAPTTPYEDDDWNKYTNFYVTHAGDLYANSADIEGKITASSGSITGNLTLNGGLLFKYRDNTYSDFKHTEFNNSAFIMKRGQNDYFKLEEVAGDPLSVSLDVYVGGTKQQPAHLKMDGQYLGLIEGDWTLKSGSNSITLAEMITAIKYIYEQNPDLISLSE